MSFLSDVIGLLLSSLPKYVLITRRGVDIFLIKPYQLALCVKRYVRLCKTVMSLSGRLLLALR